MTILVVPLQHPFAGTSRSRRRARFIPVPASAGRRSRTSPQSSHRAQQQRPIRNHQRLSALSDLRKTIPGHSRSAPNPHSRPGVHRLPAGSFFGGFRTPALYRVDRSRRAGIRNPSRNRSSGPSIKAEIFYQPAATATTGSGNPMPGSWILPTRNMTVCHSLSADFCLRRAVQAQASSDRQTCPVSASWERPADGRKCSQQRCLRLSGASAPAPPPAFGCDQASLRSNRFKCRSHDLVGSLALLFCAQSGGERE